MADRVTKVKNEGRVESGKRLAAWNKKRKEDLLKSAAGDQVPAQVPAQEPTQEPTQVPTQVLTQVRINTLVTTVTIVAGVLLIGLVARKKMACFLSGDAGRSDRLAAQHEQQQEDSQTPVRKTARFTKYR